MITIKARIVVTLDGMKGVTIETGNIGRMSEMTDEVLLYEW